MTHANQEPVPDKPAQRRRPGHSPARVAGAADQAATTTSGGALADSHTVRDARRGGTAFRDNPRRIGRAREGATPLDDSRDRRARGTRSGVAHTAPDRPATGDRDRDRGRAETAEGGTTSQGSLAEPALEGADRGGAVGPQAGGADSGETQQ